MITALSIVPTAAHALARAGSKPAATSPSHDRPRYHIAAPAGGWINDPQRPLRVGDEWVLWALYNPTYPHDGTSWRRWTSQDLVNWQDRGISIPRNTNSFGDVWSGSTVIDTYDTAGFGAGSLITLVTMPTPETGQSCALWFSRDGGASFTFHDIVLRNHTGGQDFRDPTVFWHAPTERWVMSLSEMGKVSFFTSSNLRQWTHASSFVSSSVGNVMECSHLFQLHLYDEKGHSSVDKWVLLVGGNGTKLGFTVGTHYWVGEFNGTAFTPDVPDGQWLDGGADFYAAVTWTDPTAPDPLASAYSIAWMSNWDYVNTIPAVRDYQGQLSLVRRLRLCLRNGRARLVSTPLERQDTVFKRSIIGQTQRIDESHAYAWPSGAESSSCRIDFALHRLDATWPSEIVFDVRKGGDHYTRITFAMRDDRVTLNRTASGPHPADNGAWMKDRSVSCDFSKGRATISLFIDTGSVELFLNDGEATMSELITTPAGLGGLRLIAVGGAVEVSDVKISMLP